MALMARRIRKYSQIIGELMVWEICIMDSNRRSDIASNMRGVESVRVDGEVRGYFKINENRVMRKPIVSLT